MSPSPERLYRSLDARGVRKTDSNRTGEMWRDDAWLPFRTLGRRSRWDRAIQPAFQGTRHHLGTRARSPSTSRCCQRRQSGPDCCDWPCSYREWYQMSVHMSRGYLPELDTVMLIKLFHKGAGTSLSNG